MTLRLRSLAPPTLRANGRETHQATLRANGLLIRIWLLQATSAVLLITPLMNVDPITLTCRLTPFKMSNAMALYRHAEGLHWQAGSPRLKARGTLSMVTDSRER